MKISRKPKKSRTASKLVLEEIIGLTTKNANGFALNVLNANCVYLAGCVVVVYNVDLGTQSHLMVSQRLPKPLSCVAISQDGRFVAAGESGHQPAVLVWDCTALAFISELKGHQYGVECIAFSSNGKHMVSVGFPHDGYMCLWDWRSGVLVTKHKTSSFCSSVLSVSFSSDGNSIVTAGKKHLKLWAVSSCTKPRSNNGAGPLLLYGKPLKLGPCKGNTFISVSTPFQSDGKLFGSGHAGQFFPMYALTDGGVLCLLQSGMLVRWVDLKVTKAFALSTSNKLIACACSSGVVKLFSIESLKYSGTLEYFEPKHGHKASNVVVSHVKKTEKDFQFTPPLPDAIACQFSSLDKLIVIYADHSLFIWDIHDVNKPTRCCALVSHSACIWDIKNLSCDYAHDPSLACVARGCSGGISFATCSSDGTIRLWDLALQPDILEVVSSKHTKNHHPLYAETVGTTHFVSAGIFERDSVESSVSTEGFRSMAVSSDGKYLAAGDCKGSLHIFNLHTSEFVCLQGAHDAEILSLSFSLPSNKDFFPGKYKENPYFLASGGRDRSIHIYDGERNFDLIETIDDHSAAVTSVKLACDGSKILSCSADRCHTFDCLMNCLPSRSLVFRDLAVMDGGCKLLRRHHQLASHGTVYDMAVDPSMEVAITVGQDKKINTFNITGGKLLKSFKQNGNCGDPMKVTMDPSCSYLVCSYSNKSICMYDFISGEMVAQAVGHGEVVTGVIFLPDCRHIISVGADGCIFVWKVPASLSLRMLQKMKEYSGPLSPTCMAKPIALSQLIFQEEGENDQCRFNSSSISMIKSSSWFDQRVLYQGRGSQETPAFKFSISRLPRWAQAKLTRPEAVSINFELASTETEELKISSSVGSGGGCAFVSPEAKTPPTYNLERTAPRLGSSSRRSIGNSTCSPLSRGRISSFPMDNRWLAIYTVCLDLPNSPDVCDLPASNLLQDPATNKASNGRGKEISLRDHNNIVDVGRETSLCEHARLHYSDPVYEDKNKLGIYSGNACHQVVSSELLEQLQSDTTESGVQAAMDVRSYYTKSQDDDLLNQHIGMSTVLKIKERKSSARRTYSAQLVLQQDCVGGCKRLFGTPRNFGEVLNCEEEIALPVTSEAQSIQLQEEQQMTDAHKQGQNNSTVEATNVRDVNGCRPAGNEMQERIIACKKVLLSLDAAAENTLHLFSTLGTLLSEEQVLGGPASQLYDEAAELLPSIAEKVNEVAKVIQSNNKGSGRKAMEEVPSFEPLLGIFAESLSQRVVDILKKNFNTL
ncbi:uncharacterized protein LOC131168119 isoform X1 [Malania oleifera]|uniref:uncharacterized protein LOC131168119 isoform X1 n=1 Tax=Malania oleifera TaxID=397392 RepID=UPI0025AE711A|nr:uncharacterized protein LOC131168119 isoform X1 [Malania oleifera]